MKKSRHKKVVQLLSIIFLSLICFTANAQKLPSTQQISVWVPDHIKIDGKATEWGAKFQAYNRANHLFYSIANDDKNLYLIVHSSDKLTIQKMVRWGVALTVSGSIKKNTKDPNNVSVSFPVEDERRNLSIIHTMGVKDISTNTDSMMTARNTTIANIFKLIKVAGIKTISEPDISVYNVLGIKAAASFDNKLGYTYELAIPLKYLNIPVNNEIRFSYNIKLNGGVEKNGVSNVIRVGGGGGDPNNDYLFSPTDFWGEYTLAKK